MTNLPSLSDLAAYAASPRITPAGWMPLTQVIPPLDQVVIRFGEAAGHCQSLYRLSGTQPNALVLREREDRLGEASFLFTDREAAWEWAGPLGPDDGGSVSDIYQSSLWFAPNGQEDLTEVSVHEYEAEDTPEAWVMLQCVCEQITTPPKARA